MGNECSSLSDPHNTLSLIERLRRSTPWTFVAIAGLASLSGVHFWRDAGHSEFAVIQGTLPNFLAVHILTFGFLMMKYPYRLQGQKTQLGLQTRSFWLLLGIVTVGLIAWEFIQRFGSLTFDRLDLLTTFVGTATAIPLFYGLRPWSLDRRKDNPSY